MGASSKDDFLDLILNMKASEMNTQHCCLPVNKSMSGYAYKKKSEKYSIKMKQSIKLFALCWENNRLFEGYSTLFQLAYIA